MARQQVEVRVPLATLLKIVAVGVLLWASVHLFSLFLFFLLSVLLAITLEPTCGWLSRKGLSRGMSVAVIAVVMLGVMALFLGVLVPAVAREIGSFATQFPQIRDRLHERASHSKTLTGLYDRAAALPQSPEVKEAIAHPLSLGALVAEGLIGVPVLLIVTLYLLLDGKTVYAWLLAYVPRKHREKMARTSDEVSGVVHAYVRGQVITSVLVGIFSYVTLKLLHVPAPLALAVIAAIFDVVPFVGFISFTVPAVVLALAVSPVTAGLVLLLYVAYHFVENYFIIPRVYGKQLRLSTLTVILALGVAGALAGVIGAILVLPLVAAIPIVERIWLRPVLGEEPLEDHAALEEASEEKDHEAVERVIEGEEHPH